MQSSASGEVGAQLEAGDEVVVKQRPLFQLQNKYIVTATKSGLLVIDDTARTSILYEELVRQLEPEGAPAATQQLLSLQPLTSMPRISCSCCSRVTGWPSLACSL